MVFGCQRSSEDEAHRFELRIVEKAGTDIFPANSRENQVEQREGWFQASDILDGG